MPRSVPPKCLDHVANAADFPQRLTDVPLWRLAMTAWAVMGLACLVGVYVLSVWMLLPARYRMASSRKPNRRVP